MTAEGGEADIALAGGAETDAGSANDVGTVEQSLEELPGRHAIGRTHPNIGSIFTAITLIAEGAQRVEHMGGVLHVVVDSSLDLLFALGCVDGLGGTLTDITAAIEFSTLATQP